MKEEEEGMEARQATDNGGWELGSYKVGSGLVTLISPFAFILQTLARSVKMCNHARRAPHTRVPLSVVISKEERCDELACYPSDSGEISHLESALPAALRFVYFCNFQRSIKARSN